MTNLINDIIVRAFTRLTSEEEGQGLAEYALILALIAVVAIAGLELLGQNVLAKLNEVAGELA